MTSVPDGHGAGISFDGANSGWTPEVVDIELPAESVEEIESWHLGSTHKKKVAGKLKSLDDVSLSIRTDIAQLPVVGAANETITITLPLLPNENTPASLSFEGNIQNFAPGKLATNSTLDGTVTLAVSGAVTWTAAT